MRPVKGMEEARKNDQEANPGKPTHIPSADPPHKHIQASTTRLNSQLNTNSFTTGAAANSGFSRTQLRK